MNEHDRTDDAPQHEPRPEPGTEGATDAGVEPRASEPTSAETPESRWAPSAATTGDAPAQSPEPAASSHDASPAVDSHDASLPDAEHDASLPDDEHASDVRPADGHASDAHAADGHAAPALVEPAPVISATDRDVNDATYDAVLDKSTPAADESPIVEPEAGRPASYHGSTETPLPHGSADHGSPDHTETDRTEVDRTESDSAPSPTVVAPVVVPAAAPQVVYVPSPTPPRKKGNRGMGVGIALAATPVFALVYAGIALLFVAIANGGIVASEAVDFFTTPSYWLPIIAFAVFYVLLALIVNRAGWWAHVLGGFVVALLVYLTFVASSLLTANAVGAPADLVQSFIVQQLTNPIGWAAAIAAREVPIWVGGLVARRGRSVTTRNAEAREAYERELAESRAAHLTAS